MHAPRLTCSSSWLRCSSPCRDMTLKRGCRSSSSSTGRPAAISAAAPRGGGMMRALKNSCPAAHPASHTSGRHAWPRYFTARPCGMQAMQQHQPVTSALSASRAFNLLGSSGIGHAFETVTRGLVNIAVLWPHCGARDHAAVAVVPHLIDAWWQRLLLWACHIQVSQQ